MELGLSERTVLRAYFMAAASIFEPEKATQRLTWARTTVLMDVSSYFGTEACSSEKRRAFLLDFNDQSNFDLCGPPLPKMCREDKTSQTPVPIGNEADKDEEEGFMWVWFFTSMAPGFVVGFWGVCGVLIFKKSWRIAYFQVCDKMMDKIFVVWMTKVPKLKTMLQDRK